MNRETNVDGEHTGAVIRLFGSADAATWSPAEQIDNNLAAIRATLASIEPSVWGEPGHDAPAGGAVVLQFRGR
jgi:hypothetical protein